VIPSGLFEQPEVRNVSGVLFSNAHTVSIFNRIGTELGYGLPGTAICRLGTTYDPDPNASEAQPFAYVVGDRPPGHQETFAEGLQLFINPWAAVKLSRRTLPSITYNELLDDGTVMSTLSPSSLHPYFSKTIVFQGRHAELYARYKQFEFLGLVPPLSDLKIREH
jgi:hypothetical protein